MAYRMACAWKRKKSRQGSELECQAGSGANQRREAGPITALLAARAQILGANVPKAGSCTDQERWVEGCTRVGADDEGPKGEAFKSSHFLRMAMHTSKAPQ